MCIRDRFETSYNFYLDDYGNVIAFEEVEAAAKNYALVLDSAFSTNMLNTSGQVKVLLPDGTTKTYELNWDNSVTVSYTHLFEVVLVLDNPGTLAEGMDASAGLTAADGTPDVYKRQQWQDC